jgi:hypothetical protein
VAIVPQVVANRSRRVAVRLVTSEDAAPIANGATGVVAVSTITLIMWRRMTLGMLTMTRDLQVITWDSGEVRARVLVGARFFLLEGGSADDPIVL